MREKTENALFFQRLNWYVRMKVKEMEESRKREEERREKKERGKREGRRKRKEGGSLVKISVELSISISIYPTK